MPIIVDGSKVVHDSWQIASYLEDRFANQPPLFGDDVARHTTRFVNLWSYALGPALQRLIYADFIWCLAPEDREYFRSSREKTLGQSLEEACADRPRWQAKFDTACLPLERLFAEQPFIAGPSRATATIWCSRSFSGRASAVPETSSRPERHLLSGAPG